MSAKLMKTLAKGTCTVTNKRSGQVRIYWSDGVENKPPVDINGHETVNLLHRIPLQHLRKCQSLKDLVHAGHLVIE